jgi:POT family proton-dependent oligopeptide transporter
MNTGSQLENVEIAKAEVGTAAVPAAVLEHEKEMHVERHSVSDLSDGETEPTEEELHTLRRVSGPIPWTAFTIAFVELCERFSYYGTTVVFVNFIQRPLPPGSNTGAGFSEQSGALGMGQRASTGLTTFNAFWAYLMPLFGAYLADAHWGRYKTIQVAIALALVGHVILIISAIPPVIVKPKGAIAAFSVGLIIMGMGVGGFKSNISPLLAEQQKQTKKVVRTTTKGERVIVDPVVTTSRIFLYFYMCINIGSLVGSIGMVYAEKYVGFWLSFLLPTIMFLFCPAVLIACHKYYVLTPPTGSVFATFCKLIGMSMKGQWSINPARTVKNLRDPMFWERVKPSNVSSRPEWMTFDDAWVEEVRRGLKACTVFLWYPLYWLAYGQMTNNLTSQAATMELNGVPNDIIQNLNPLSIVILIPLLDFFIYPALRRARIPFTPLKRIFGGFILASMAMVSACVIQYYIYKMGPCGDAMNTCEEPAPINVWVQTIPYILIGFSEVFASITGLEYAFTKAPKNMRSLVMALFLFMNAFSSALAQALVALAEDPLLVWNYGVVAVLAFVGGILFWISHHKLDKEEDKLNMLGDSDFKGGKKMDDEKSV